MRQGFLTGSPLTWRALAGPGVNRSPIVVVDTHDGAVRRKKGTKRRVEGVELREPTAPSFAAEIPEIRSGFEPREIADGVGENLRESQTSRRNDDAVALMLLFGVVIDPSPLSEEDMAKRRKRDDEAATALLLM